MIQLQSSGNYIDNKKKKRKKSIILTIVALFVTVIVLAAGILYFYYNKNLGAMDSANKESVTVEIPIGSNAESIGEELEEKGVINSGKFFKLYTRVTGEGNFQAGVYQLSPSMNLTEIIAALKEGKLFKKPELTLTIPEGYNVPQIAGEISTKTGYKKEEVLKVMKGRTFLKELSKKYKNIPDDIYKEGLYYPLEGFLFPATYDFDKKKPELKDIVDKMVEQSSIVIAKYESDMKKSGYSVFETITLASLIEEESQREEDRKKISGVFHNRLDQDMKLDSDPTVKYARKDFGVQVLYEHLKVDSPYNTYRYKGIPIGPIASPGEKSIEAALKPVKMEELFFYARPNGEVIYTKTLQEHHAIYQKYKDEWKVWHKEQ
ncbi:endolytic transglycosylase MltG [Fictibacillus phosphorivorans]|uniref:endolytic transglycosylase MltG n=1 Tax=Fictibacillus phosphorivorans TaxID=1221500 RepID=UPI0020407F2D|nr:endolytic transglycosylase MltG [Fictibacillus phosphorivorans]MCM3716958.1 endolytic transglycosylase MltG [Fictibacillus phosphorivorans]MCM3774493.1 endolytic transglycosylase MltG [Fictibacillus phosphorivorans]